MMVTGLPMMWLLKGVSLVSNYRSTFAAIVKNDGMDGLLLIYSTELINIKHPRKSPAAKLY